MSHQDKPPAPQTNTIATYPGEKAWNLFLLFWAGMGLLLFAASWKLWIPQNDFPMIPCFEWLVSAPMWLDWVAVGGIVGGLLGVLALACRESAAQYRGGLYRGHPVTDERDNNNSATGCHRYQNEDAATGCHRYENEDAATGCHRYRCRWHRFFLFLFFVAVVGSILLNQHRLQPWAYQFAIFAVLIACAPRDSAWRMMRWITISIYLYSAASKFDYQFVHTMGPNFLDAMLAWVGSESRDWNVELIGGLVILFPLYELLMGLCLIWKKTRRVAVVGIVLMHGALIAILGPWGLRHEAGVLIWNVYLMGQAVLLFGYRQSSVPGFRIHSSSAALIPINALFWLVLLFPMTVPLGFCDHWPAWEVYAPRSSRAKLEIGLGEIDHLPAGFRDALRRPAEDFQSFEFDLAQWSIHRLNVPIYPEDRFQFAVAATIVQRHNLESVRVHVGGVADRFTGERTWTTLQRHDELERFRGRFFFNTRPRN